jgi:putative transposase
MPKPVPPRPRKQMRPTGCSGIRRSRIARNRIVQVRRTLFHLTRLLAWQIVYLVETGQNLLIFDIQGTDIMNHRWLKPGAAYVGSDWPRRRQPRNL